MLAPKGIDQNVHKVDISTESKKAEEMKEVCSREEVLFESDIRYQHAKSLSFQAKEVHAEKREARDERPVDSSLLPSKEIISREQMDEVKTEPFTQVMDSADKVPAPKDEPPQEKYSSIKEERKKETLGKDVEPRSVSLDSQTTKKLQNQQISPQTATEDKVIQKDKVRKEPKKQKKGIQAKLFKMQLKLNVCILCLFCPLFVLSYNVRRLGS